MPEDKLSQIFNPFYTTKPNGNGLGMGIAKKVMDAHNGRIEVHSQTGTGTEFLISLPISDALRPGVIPEVQPDGENFNHGNEAAQRPADGADLQPEPELRSSNGVRQ
ncbi:MAG TPA: ATP-binding protein [Candidatus Binataceae bacterium]